MQKKEIMTDISTFEELIGRNGLYVDKTRYFYKLVSGGGTFYFLSRPRGFGKSLAMSIFKNIFLGRRELFKGLYIDGTDYDWQKFPVIHLDMSKCDADSGEKLKDSLNKSLSSVAQQYGVELDNDSPSMNFNSLISKIKRKTGKNVVILVDEHDRPLFENLGNAEELKKIRRILGEFYQMIKGNDPNERFVFMTGVTRFCETSIFGGLNNLTDISMRRDYGEMFGYTQEELETNFAPYIDEHVAEIGRDRAELMAEIKKWYGGFKFDYKCQTVYNPVSVGQFFANKCEFQNYWLTTSTLMFIKKLAGQQRLERADINEEIVSDMSLSAFDITRLAFERISKIRFVILLLKMGCLTIDEKIDDIKPPAFSVRFPNYEVDYSLSKTLFET